MYVNNLERAQTNLMYMQRCNTILSFLCAIGVIAIFAVGIIYVIKSIVPTIEVKKTPEKEKEKNVDRVSTEQPIVETKVEETKVEETKVEETKVEEPIVANQPEIKKPIVEDDEPITLEDENIPSNVIHVNTSTPSTSTEDIMSDAEEEEWLRQVSGFEI